MNPPTDCPRCGQPAVADPTCPRCGVVMAKARPHMDRRRGVMVPSDAPAPPARMGGGSLVLVGAALLMAGAVGSRMWERAHRPAPAAHEAPVERSPMARAAEGPPPSLSVPLALPAAPVHVEAVQVADTDRPRMEDLARRLANPSSLTAADVRTAEELLSAHPDERPLRDLLEAVLLAAAARHERQRQFPPAVAYLQRAQQVQPTSTRPPLGLLQVAMEMEDWPTAEAAARAVVAIDPRRFDGWQGLGYALMRQDRNREAIDALRAALEVRDDSNTRLIMERIAKGLADERGMAERRVSHFNVRYDGEEHEDLGREIVLELEHHYATLAGTLDCQPTSTVPVILFTRQAYYNASGAPAWSGGAYDNIDGRIRIPVGGLTTSLSPEMDGTLIHELTHAFIADRTRGVAPRELHEGLAQYMEGKRLESMLGPDQVRALADGRIGGVWGFYLGALSFVEYLMANRGQGGMNDLLKVMGETGSADEAFRQVYGGSFRATQQAWAERFRQQHGST